MHKILVILVCFMLLSASAYAHPPSKVTLEYKKTQDVFTLIINHRVTSKRHFIKEIVIKLNGEKIRTKHFAFQNNKRIVTFSFQLPDYKKEDILSVEITCNRTGTIEKDFSLYKVLEKDSQKE